MAQTTPLGHLKADSSGRPAFVRIGEDKSQPVLVEGLKQKQERQYLNRN